MDADSLHRDVQGSGDLLAVNTPLGGELLVDVAVSSVFTPNGDGVNETLTFAYKLREVTAARPLQVRIYDLGGRPVAQLPALEARSGIFSQQWDGRDDGGELVGPGIYIYELTLDSEEQHTQMGSFAVAY